jgi:hypothetical protein
VTSNNKSISTRVFNPEELKVFCPIMTMMHSLNLIGLSGMRVVHDDLGQIGYIITIYERFRSEKKDVVDIGANI